MIIDNAGYDDGDSALRSATRGYTGNDTGDACFCEDDAGYDDGDFALRSATRGYAGNDTENACFCEDDAGYDDDDVANTDYAGYNNDNDT